MTKSRKNNVFVNNILHIAGVALCTLPPAICTLLYFPLWIESGSTKTLAGSAAFLLVISAIPLFKLLKRYFSSPASYVLWLVAFLVFSLVSRVAHEMTVITFVGFVSNAIGAVIFLIADKYYPRNAQETENE